MDDLEYHDAFRDDDPVPPRFDNGNLGGIVSSVMAWILFFVIIVGICMLIGSVV